MFEDVTTMPRTKQPTVTPDEVSRDKSYSVSQVAGLLDFHPGHVKRLLREGRVKGFRPNGYEWRVSGEEVLRLLEGREYHGGLLLPKPSPLEGVSVNVIEVSPELTRIICPDWQPADEEAA
jgi:excisionase family DNA binding protein